MKTKEGDALQGTVLLALLSRMIDEVGVVDPDALDVIMRGLRSTPGVSVFLSGTPEE